MDRSSENGWQYKLLYLCFLLINLGGLSAYIWHLQSGWMPERIWFIPFQLFTVYWSGIYLLIAFGIGFGVAYFLPTYGLEIERIQVFNRPLTLLFLGWIGARLLDVLFLSPVSVAQGISSPSDYFQNPLFLIDTNWGGLNIWGGISLVTLWLIWRSWRKGVPLAPILFKGVVGLLIGTNISQWGHFLTQQKYGRPYSGFGNIFVQPEYRLPELLEAPTYFPIFFIGACWFLVGALWLMFDKRWRISQVNQIDGILLGGLWFITGKLALELSAVILHFNGLVGMVGIFIILGTIFFRISR